MELREMKEEEFRTFLDKHPLKTFMQTPEIASLRRMNGWDTVYLGMYNEKELLGASLLLSKKRSFGKREFYCLRGPLLDYENLELIKTFLTLLINYTKKHQGYLLRMDPYLVYKERNGKGEIIEGGIDHYNVVTLFKELNFNKVPQEKEEQVSYMYVLDIEGKTEEQILKNMKANTRNTIRKTLKNGIEIKELKKDELNEFYKIMVETGKRKGFLIRELSYFVHMYELFNPRGEIKYLVTKLNLSKHISLLEEEKEKTILEKENLSEAKYNDGKRKDLENAINSLDKRISKAKEIKEKNGEVITLSGSMFIMTKPEIIYLSSGNYEEYMHYNSQYLIQWEMIRYGLENGFKRYNFYGIPSSFDKNDKDYGIYEFKTGFQGYVEQLVGEYEKPLSVIYYLIKFFSSLKK